MATSGSDVEGKRRQKLQNLETAKLEQDVIRQRRRQQQRQLDHPEEDIKAFLADWHDRSSSAKEALVHFRARQPAELAAERSKAKTAHDELAQQLYRLDQEVSRGSYFLPAFEIRHLTEIVKDLRTQLLTARREVLPRQPFRFTHQDAIVLVEDPLKQGLTFEGSIGAHFHETEYDPGAPAGDCATTISHLNRQIMHFNARQVAGRDFMLSDLQDCTILLHGPLQALYLDKLKRCHIQAGPVSGATLVETADSCTLMLATHQLRLHHVKDTIVHCLPYPEFSDGLIEAKIAPGNEKWKAVQDFQYPGHAKSPNWCRLAEEQFVVPLDGVADVKEVSSG